MLFLDELLEFPRLALEALRQPIEAGAVSLARIEVYISHQACFHLVAAMNSCHCGYAEDPDLACHRLPICRQEYIGRRFGRCSTGLMSASMSEMMGSEKGEASAIIAARVGAAREVQMARQNRSMHILTAGRFISWGSGHCRPEPARPHGQSEKIEGAGF